MQDRIHKHLAVLSKYANIVDYTAGTNMIPIEFIIDDWEIPYGATAAIYVKKPSGAVLYNEAEVDRDKNALIVTPTIQLFIEGGNLPAQLQILYDGKILNSFLITFHVQVQIVSNEAVESTNEFTMFASILQNVTTLTESVVQDYVEANGITTGANASQVAQIQANADDIASLGSDVAAILDNMAEVASRITDLVATVETLVTTVNSMVETVGSSARAIQDLQKRVNDIETGVGDLGFDDLEVLEVAEDD